jgi:hypothetical protein
MRDLKPLGSEDVELWIKYWDAAGLFNEETVRDRRVHKLRELSQSNHGYHT